MDNALLANTVIGTTSFLLGWVVREFFGPLYQQQEQQSKPVVPRTSSQQLIAGSLDVDPDEEMKLLLIVRADLKMGKGKAAAQCCHATLAAYKSALRRNPKILKNWEQSGQAKVVVKAQSDQEMVELERAANRAGIPANAIHDAGRTQIAAGSKTVLALGPAPKSHIDRIAGHLKLF